MRFQKHAIVKIAMALLDKERLHKEKLHNIEAKKFKYTDTNFQWSLIAVGLIATA